MLKHYCGCLDEEVIVQKLIKRNISKLVMEYEKMMEGRRVKIIEKETQVDQTKSEHKPALGEQTPST